MGKKEGEVMMELIYKHNFFRRTEAVDFQGVCGISPYAPKVCNWQYSKVYIFQMKWRKRLGRKLFVIS